LRAKNKCAPQEEKPFFEKARSAEAPDAGKKKK
jgi:hypothetical protein